MGGVGVRKKKLHTPLYFIIYDFWTGLKKKYTLLWGTSAARSVKQIHFTLFIVTEKEGGFKLVPNYFL